uniref:FAM3 metabolism regulating signaling molecule A n=1 Tax=Neovison vison TaxID=452646 RepID=A0A8C7ESA4_NEOVI
MRLAGPIRIVALVVTVGLTWIVVSILLGGPGSGFPRIQQLFAKPRARKYKCGLPQPCPEEHLAFRMVSGAANVIGPKICLEDKMLMSSVKDNVGRGLNIALVNGVSGELIEARAFDMWAGGESPCIARSLTCHPLPMAVAPWVRKRQGQGQVYTHQGCYTSLSLHPHGDPSWVCPWPDPFF